jgi:hypothetical protein
MDERLMKIRDAYEEAGREQPSEYPLLPAWEALSQELREAIIHVYYRGRFEAPPRDAEPKWSSRRGRFGDLRPEDRFVGHVVLPLNLNWAFEPNP